MTIENSNLSNRFHFDLSASYSRSVTRELASNILSNDSQSRFRSNNESFYSPSSSVNLLERALSDGLGKKVSLQENNDGRSPAKIIAKNVLSFVRQELREARNGGASDQELLGILNEAREGIEQGFASAKDALRGRFDLEPRLERQIERAFNKIERGLERIDNRITQNVSTSDQALLTTPGSNPSGSEINRIEVLQKNLQASQAQTRQIEYLKTRDIQRSSSFELSVKTQEGDTVKLSIEKSFSKQVSKQATFDESGFNVSIDRQVERGKEISYQVSGDINKQEQAAIDKLIKNVDRLADKFYRGNFAGAFQKASRIGIDTDQLANFSLNLQSSKTVEVTKTYREVQGIATSQQTSSAVESIGEFVGDVGQVASEDAIANAVSDPVPLTTELFKQIAIRDERYAQLVFEQSVDVIDDLANLAEQQLANAA
ncbi:MAG: DUF5610 domain-containing protein [Gammaproteobacteria bacterium]|nr:DUF5610 domain-containing protein [Gammaproteobacteria bacterium]